MTEEEWLDTHDVHAMGEWLEKNRISRLEMSRKYLLLNSACCRELRPWYHENALAKCVDIVELFVDGKVKERTFGKWRRRAGDIHSDTFGQIPASYNLTARSIVALFTNRHVSYPPGWDGWRTICEHCIHFHSDFITQSKQLVLQFLRDIFGNPFRPVTFAPEWRTEAAVGIASQMYDSRDFGNMPILADVLQDAGCELPEILNHCREPGTHVRGCWVVDLVLGKS